MALTNPSERSLPFYAAVQCLAIAAVFCIGLSSAGASGAAPASAPISAPSEQVILTLDGAVSVSNTERGADFDRAMLEKLPRTKFSTSTPWTTGKVEFEGVMLKDLIAAVGASGVKLNAVALNNYASEMKISDIAAHALIADRVDGKPMSVRTRGPLWIMFPFDDNPSLKSEQYYSKSVWQLRRLTFIK